MSTDIHQRCCELSFRRSTLFAHFDTMELEDTGTLSSEDSPCEVEDVGRNSDSENGSDSDTNSDSASGSDIDFDEDEIHQHQRAIGIWKKMLSKCSELASYLKAYEQEKKDTSTLWRSKHKHALKGLCSDFEAFLHEPIWAAALPADPHNVSKERNRRRVPTKSCSDLGTSHPKNAPLAKKRRFVCSREEYEDALKALEELEANFSCAPTAPLKSALTRKRRAETDDSGAPEHGDDDDDVSTFVCKRVRFADPLVERDMDQARACAQ